MCLGIMPRHCSTNSRGEAIPAAVRRCAAWSAKTPWHYAAHSRTTGALHPRRRTAEPSKGRQTTMQRPWTTRLRRDDGTGHLRRHRPCAPIPAVPDAIPATASPSPTLWRRAATGRRHASYCTPVRPRVNGTLESSHRAVARQETSTQPPSKPLLGTHRTRHDAPPEARFARTAVYFVTLCTMPLHAGEIVRYACKLPPPWPIKGGVVP
jgi:hypothetical protein